MKVDSEPMHSSFKAVFDIPIVKVADGFHDCKPQSVASVIRAAFVETAEQCAWVECRTFA